MSVHNSEDITCCGEFNCLWSTIEIFLAYDTNKMNYSWNYLFFLVMWGGKGITEKCVISLICSIKNQRIFGETFFRSKLLAAWSIKEKWVINMFIKNVFQQTMEHFKMWRWVLMPALLHGQAPIFQPAHYIKGKRKIYTVGWPNRMLKCHLQSSQIVTLILCK